MAPARKDEIVLQDNPVQKETTQLIIGRNAVSEVLRSRQEVESIYIQKGMQKGGIGRILALAKDQGVPVKEVAQAKLDALSEGENHQGVAALMAAYAYASLEEIIRPTGKPALIVLADGIEDPHNLGAIIRTAEAVGANGLVVPKRRSAGLSPIVGKTSAGAVAHLPVARVPNLVAAIGWLKEQGVWIYCADMEGQSYAQADLTGPVALVIGSEGKGVSRLVRENCDFTLSLPMFGRINSLNASVAAGILMYEVVRQRNAAPPTL